MLEIPRVYDREGWRRIPPSERSPGLVELRPPNGRTFSCAGFGPDAERAVSDLARKAQRKGSRR